MKISGKDEDDLCDLLLKYKRMKLCMYDKTVVTIDIADLEELLLEDN